MSAKIALFALDSAIFALPVEGIRHILCAPRIFSLPLLRSEFCGVFLYQGDVVPLLNLWKHFGMNLCPSASQFTIVMGTEVGLVGLPVVHVRRIVDRDLGVLEDAVGPEVTSVSGRVFDCAETKYPLLDIEELIDFLPTEEIIPVLSSKGTKEA